MYNVEITSYIKRSGTKWAFPPIFETKGPGKALLGGFDWKQRQDLYEYTHC